MLSKFQRRFSSVVQQADPFLERFTVTGRAILEEHQHAIWFCEDIFTLK